MGDEVRQHAVGLAARAMEHHEQGQRRIRGQAFGHHQHRIAAFVEAQVVAPGRQRFVQRRGTGPEGHAAGERAAEQGGVDHAVPPGDAAGAMPRNTAHCAKDCVDSGSSLRRQYLLVSLSSSLMSRPLAPA